jgi:uncharacterized RDD family membrane protein YckC
MDSSNPIKRFLAAVIDVILMTRVVGPVLNILLRDQFPRDDYTGSLENLASALDTGIAIVWIAYFILMEWAPWGGTFGKLALGIRVVDEQGNRPSLWCIVKRNLGKLLSVPTLSGAFVIAFFTRSHQSLYDILSRSRVVTERHMF